MFHIVNPLTPSFYFSTPPKNNNQVKRDMVQIKHELDTVQQVKEEIEELREYVDRLEEHTHRRKLRLLEQVSTRFHSFQLYSRLYVANLFRFTFMHVSRTREAPSDEKKYTGKQAKSRSLQFYFIYLMFFMRCFFLFLGSIPTPPLEGNQHRDGTEGVGQSFRFTFPNRFLSIPVTGLFFLASNLYFSVWLFIST